MRLRGLKVIMTPLDPIPPRFRSALGCVAVNPRELAAYRAGDTRMIDDVCDAQTKLDARYLIVTIERSIERNLVIQKPSERMRLLDLISRRPGEGAV